MQKTPPRKVTIQLDEETERALLMAGSLTGNGRPQSIEHVILDAIFQWRKDHPIKLLRPSEDEVVTYFKRNGFEQRDPSEALESLHEERRRTA